MSATRNGQPMNEEIGNALTDTDYANLARRWIDRQLAEEARIRRVGSDTGRLFMGRRDHGSYEGLAIPYFLPGESRVREWRLRRDHPDIEYKDGQPRERGKYLSPPGRRNMIYFVPGTSQDLVKAVATPVIVYRRGNRSRGDRLPAIFARGTWPKTRHKTRSAPFSMVPYGCRRAFREGSRTRGGGQP
jgi:hypothetical protein